jgi:protease II
MAEGHKNWKKN